MNLNHPTHKDGVLRTERANEIRDKVIENQNTKLKILRHVMQTHIHFSSKAMYIYKKNNIGVIFDRHL